MADNNFSTLEVLSPEYEPLRKGKYFGDASGKQVVNEDQGKHVYITEDVDKQVVPLYTVTIDSPYVINPRQQQHDNYQDEHSPDLAAEKEGQNRRSRKWMWIAVGVALVVILAAVLGGVLGSKKSKHSSTSSSPASSNSTSNVTSNIVDHSRNIAAVTFPRNSINNTCIYYQEEDGSLVEAAQSASDTTWTFSTIGQLTLNKSAIAAAVSRPNYTLEISVLYTDADYLIHNLIYNSTARAWAEGSISAAKYITHPSSRLAVMYNQCRLCSNTTLVAYQDANGYIQVANDTASGWSLTQLKTDNIVGTGLAMRPFYRTNQTDQINLYHQTAAFNIILATWTPGRAAEGVTAWADAQQVYDRVTENTPLAVAASYSAVANGGYATWAQLLQISDSGVEVSTWSGKANDWIESNNHPSVMANSTSNVKNYTSIAVTASGAAFAVVQATGNNSIQGWQVGDNMLDWTSTGMVTSWD